MGRTGCRRAWLAGAIAATACGRLNIEPLATDDAGGSIGDARDARDASEPPCTFGPWGQPRNLTELVSNYDDWAASLTADGLRIVFDSNRPSGIDGYDLYEATRASTDDPFDPPVLIPGLNSTGHQDGGYLTADGLTLYFHDMSSGTERMLVTTRPTLDDPFEAPIVIPGLEGVPGWSPRVTDDGLELFYSWFNMNLDVYRATRASTSEPFGPPERVDELSTAAYDGFVYPQPDGLTVLLSSDRSGTYKNYSATRATRDSVFSMPELVIVEHDSPSHTSDPVLSRDGTTFIFSSQRPGGVGAYDLWMMTRACVP